MSLFLEVQAAQHRDCSRLPYHHLLHHYVKGVKGLSSNLRAPYDVAVDDCLVSSAFASRWVDVLLPECSDTLPQASSVSVAPTLFAQGVSREGADVVTPAFLASHEGMSCIAAALSDVRRNAAAAVGLSRQKPAVIVPFSSVHDAKRTVVLLDTGSASNRRKLATTTAAVAAVGLMLRLIGEIPTQQRQSLQLDFCLIPPSVEFSLIIECGRFGPQWSPELLAADTSLRVAFLAKALGCRGVVGLHSNMEEKKKFQSLGVRHGRWPLWDPAADDTSSIHRTAQAECSRLAHRFQQSETNIRHGFRR